MRNIARWLLVLTCAMAKLVLSYSRHALLRAYEMNARAASATACMTVSHVRACRLRVWRLRVWRFTFECVAFAIGVLIASVKSAWH